MSPFKVNKTIAEINEKIRRGKAVVVTAEEIIGIVEEKGAVKAAAEVDVVTTGTFGPMCSSGAFMNFGHSQPRIKAHRAWLNDVPVFAGLASVDVYVGVTEPREDDPLNKVFPGEFRYGGGHVLQDLLNGKTVLLRTEAYGTDCYPRKKLEKELSLKNIPEIFLFNPRNGYQNYNCAVNLSEKTIYTYMGVLRPNGGNANYCSAGQLSPLLNDPLYKTIGVGTRIFLGGGQGFVSWRGTQHSPNVKRGANHVPRTPAGTLSVLGDLKQMSPEWIVGASFQGYGCTLVVGLGIPIPILNEEIAQYTAVKDEDIFTQIVDYSKDYPDGGPVQSLGEVNYRQLKSGKIRFNGKEIPATPLSSYPKAKKICETLRDWIQKGEFLLGEPQQMLPSATPPMVGEVRKPV
ncbi:MAG TPA: homocysteine biosynthesis protein [Thermodesulfobacteriota bacterium]|nr:homocysteine biosynthesis protein [Thermodesulfobacteriota bacterium]